MKKLAAVNGKGGSGKSTLCCQLGHAGVEANLRVLLVDLDQQGSLSIAFPPTGAHEGDASTSSALFADGSTIIPEVLSPSLSIIRADEFLEKLSCENREGLKRPARYLRALASQFDLCIIDTPGALGDNVPTTTAALVAADAVVSPFAVGLFETKPLAKLWTYLQAITRNGMNPRLRVLGLVPSKVNMKSEEELGALHGLRNHPAVGKHILPCVIGERASVKQAVAKGKPVWRGVRGDGHRTAAAEWKTATQIILSDLGVLK